MTILAIPVLAQQNMAAIKNGSMSSVMMESVRMHLKTADKALSTGNFSNALEQMNLAQMQTFGDGNEGHGHYEPVPGDGVHEGWCYKYKSDT